jgi:hypothetical protein
MSVEQEPQSVKDGGEIPHHGVPPGACEDEPKGLPTSDRHLAETSAAENGGGQHRRKAPSFTVIRHLP